MTCYQRLTINRNILSINASSSNLLLDYLPSIFINSLVPIDGLLSIIYSAFIDMTDSTDSLSQLVITLESVTDSRVF
jgi:hypothetical protein